jgi:phosphoribosylamine--glycine ligase
MRYVVIGSGGREHAIGWKLVREQAASQVFFLPGNGGTADVGQNVDIDPMDFDAVSAFCSRVEPDLVVVGPENPLAAGIVDRLGGAGHTVFGPTAACARIEGSKAFAKHLMSKYAIPTAPYKVCTSAREAHAFIQRRRRPLVVKADGLAMGKGVVVAKDKREAHEAVDMIMERLAFGDAGRAVVIEERLAGEEASVLAVTDGENYVLLPPSQDHKPVYDGDRGPNTGGMGACCPTPVVDTAGMDEIGDKVFQRLLRAFKHEGCDYRGVVYAGLMINASGIFVIEFNARFGDPEIQSILPAIDADLGPVLMAAARGSLKNTYRVEASRWAVSVVLASAGYPGEYEKGRRITGIKEASRQGVTVFHAGTKRLPNGSLVTSGGRVLAVTGTGGTLREARRKAYRAGRRIKFAGVHMRTDIGAKGLEQLERMEVT